MVGLVSGVLCGLFFGEQTSGLKWIGDAFVGLLQMAVLPYVAVSLIANIGRLSFEQGVHVLRCSLQVMILLWLIGLAALCLMTQAFPSWETGSFFSSRFTEEPPAPDWLALFIPSNPFRSFTENSIPAVVVFCIGIGVALFNLPNKEKLLGPLDVLADALSNLNRLVIKLTPLGMFAIAAYTAGTIDIDQFRLTQGYLLTYCGSSTLMTFVVLPLLLSAITPFKYWEVLRASREAVITAFVIGNTFVVLPMIVESIKRLEREQESDSEPDSHQPDFLVPLAYPFPDVGRILGLVFIPFAAWFYGTVIDPDSVPALLGVGFFGSFGKPIITIPLLLTISELPSDIFNLYLASGVIAARFGDLMKTMHMVAFTILTMCMLRGAIRLRTSRILAASLGSLLLLGTSSLLIKGYLQMQFHDLYSKDNLVTQRDMLFPENTRVSETKVTVKSESSPHPIPIAEGQTRIQRIKEYGSIRVGFDPNRMPFSYFRADSNVLIGFDIQMAYYLADDLQVGIEFIPMDSSGPSRQLMEDHFDVAMSAMEGTVEQAAQTPAIEPYMEATMAVVVPDHDKRRFADRDSVLGHSRSKAGRGEKQSLCRTGVQGSAGKRERD